VPVLKADLASEEPIGLDALRDLAEALYGATDPAEVLHAGCPLRVETRDGHHLLSIELPFADRDDLELSRRDDELLVRVGPYRRAIILPDSLKRRSIGEASMQEGRLTVVFRGDGAATTGAKSSGHRQAAAR
jgi:arsenite-transporting ATPase